MAKLFSPNNSSNSNQTNIPTAEQNQALYLSIQLREQQLNELKRQDSLAIEQKKQSVDLESASSTSPMSDVQKDEYGQIYNPNQNQDMSKYPEEKSTDLNTIGKLTDSVPPVITNILFAFLAIVIIRFIFGKKG